MNLGMRTTLAIAAVLTGGWILSEDCAVRAATITFDESGYTAAATNATGNILGQKGGETTASWGSVSAFTVVAGAGKGGTNGLVSAANASQYQSSTYNPNASEMGDVPFDPNTSKVAFSVDVMLAKSNTNGSILRLYIGQNTAASNTYAIALYINGSGSYSAGSHTSDGTPLSDHGWHTFSGVIDFGAKTYSLSFDGTQQVPSATFNGSGTTAYTNYGGFKPNLQTSDYVNNEVRLDNLQYSPVPEPASLGLLTLGGLLLAVRR